MNEMTLSGTSKMSSREIAELMDKEHYNVTRDIKTLIEQGAIDALNFEGISYVDAQNRNQSAYLLDFDATMTLITGYDAVRRAKVIKRWRELETGMAVPAHQIPQTYAEALRALADETERRENAERTKAYIGQRREATAMNTASQFAKKNRKLEEQLDYLKEYCTIKRMSMIYHGQIFDWRELKAASQLMNLPAISVFDQNYGTVRSYHRDVWMEVYAISAD
jgi:Rha family phage regulatory protein